MKSTAIAVLLPQLPSRSCSTARLADFVSLMKPRVMSLAVFTALVGLLIAPGHLDPVLGFIAILAIAAGRWRSACSSCSWSSWGRSGS
jgi:protoheme IX farnesyltransferase